MGCIQGRRVIHAYYEPNGDLVQFQHPKNHRPSDEFKFVSSQDSNHFQALDDCYIISAPWLTEWLEFALKKNRKWPGPISNKRLLNFDNTFQTDLKPKDDYRPINQAVWEYLFKLYGGGPVIYFKGQILRHTFSIRPSFVQ